MFPEANAEAIGEAEGSRALKDSLIEADGEKTVDVSNGGAETLPDDSSKEWTS
jgi:hypothetical protein